MTHYLLPAVRRLGARATTPGMRGVLIMSADDVVVLASAVRHPHEQTTGQVMMDTGLSAWELFRLLQGGHMPPPRKLGGVWLFPPGWSADFNLHGSCLPGVYPAVILWPSWTREACNRRRRARDAQARRDRLPARAGGKAVRL